MSKRKPTTDLNHENWDEEVESEEAGTFRLADQDVLKNRTIRKARRTVHTESSGSGNIFAGFALKTTDSLVPKPSLSTGITGVFGKTFGLESQSNGTQQAAPNIVNNGNSSENPEYLRQLKVLNENILSWIQKHVSDNPYCILTPSFSDYEKHLSNLEKKYNVESSTVSEKKPTSDGADSAPTKSYTTSSPFQFGAGSKMPGGLSGFTFGQSAATKSTDASKEENADSKGSGPTTGFSFGTGLTTGFGASNPSQGTGGFFSFAPAQSKIDTPKAPEAAGDDEEYVPPQVEVREIKEDGAVYTTRCKLFHQKNGQWADRGVGNLHLKPTGDGRTQLIIRADTNLGNILLNILLSAGIPTKRQGKNNVFLVCVQNPPIDSAKPTSDPTPMLIRVKTAEAADELLAKLEENKTSA